MLKRSAKLVLAITAALTLSSLASAQAPAQTAPVKIGIVDSAAFTQPGGITRMINALRTLDAEFKGRRDEIASLIARLETLQKVPPGTTEAQLAVRRDQAQTLQIDIQRKQEDARSAFTKRHTALTEPIRLSILTALEAYAKQRGIDVVIDVSKFPESILLVNANAALTVGFIRDFNSKNP